MQSPFSPLEDFPDVPALQKIPDLEDDWMDLEITRGLENAVLEGF